MFILESKHTQIQQKRHTTQHSEATVNRYYVLTKCSLIGTVFFNHNIQKEMQNTNKRTTTFYCLFTPNWHWRKCYLEEELELLERPHRSLWFCSSTSYWISSFKQNNNLDHNNNHNNNMPIIIIVIISIHHAVLGFFCLFVCFPLRTQL